MKTNVIISALLKAAPIHELFNLRSRLISSFEEMKEAQAFSLRTMDTARQLDREIERRLGSKPYFWVRYEEGVCGHKHFEITSAVECLGRRDTIKTDAEIVKLTSKGAFLFRDGYLLPVHGREEVDLLAEYGEARDAIVRTVDHDKVISDAIIVAALDLDTEARSEMAARLIHSVTADVVKSNRMMDVATKDLQSSQCQN